MFLEITENHFHLRRGEFFLLVGARDTIANAREGIERILFGRAKKAAEKREIVSCHLNAYF